MSELNLTKINAPLVKHQIIATIILNWNGLHDTINCVNSVLKDGINPLDIFLIDNGSNNNEFDQLTKIFPEINNLISLPKNVGFAGGMNFGLQKVIKNGYKYAFLLNNDTLIIQKGVIYGCLKTLKNNESIGIVSPSIMNNKDGTNEQKDLILDTKGLKKLAYRFLFPPYKGDWGESKITSNDDLILENKLMLHGVAIGIRLDIIKDIQYFFNKDFFCYEEDRDLMIRVRNENYKLCKIANLWIYHKWSGSTSKNSKFKIYHKTKNLWFMRNQYYSKRFIVFSYIKLFLVSLKNYQLKTFLKGMRDSIAR